jgi:hypothetical protein
VCLGSANAASSTHFGSYDRESHPGGSWNLLSLEQLNEHKAEFVNQYNANGGVNVIKTFKAGNCCFALESGKMVKVVGSAYGYQFPAASSGGIMCSPSNGYSGLLHFYRSPHLATDVQFEETSACELNHNPSIWMKFDPPVTEHVDFAMARVDKISDANKAAGWQLADLDALIKHKSEFIAQYRATSGIKTLEPFTSDNCCVATGNTGQMLFLGGPGLPAKVYPSQNGAMKCNVKYDGTYKFIDSSALEHSYIHESFYSMKACELKGNPAIYFRITQVKVATPTSAPTFARNPGCICELSAWGTWSTCSKPCGGGVHNRMRTSNKCASCSAPLVEKKECNTNQCVPADIKDSSPGVFATLKFRNMETSAFLKQHTFFTEYLTSALGWYPGWIRITKIKHDVSTFCDRVSVAGLDNAHEQGERMGEFNLIDSYLSGGKAVYKNGKNYLYYYPPKGYWLIGPEVGSAKAGIIGELKTTEENQNPPVSVKHWYIFDSKTDKWARDQITVKCHALPRTDVQFQIAAPNCDAATMQMVPTQNKIAAIIPALKNMLAEKKFPVTSAVVVATRNQGCAPRIKLTMTQPKAAKLIKSECTFNKITNKIEISHDGPEDKFNCFHKLDQATKKWQCYCHSWHKNAVAATPSPTPQPIAHQLAAAQAHNEEPKQVEGPGKWVMQDGWWKMDYKQ